MGAFLAILGIVTTIAGIILLIKPMPKLGIPTRGKAGLLVLGGFIIMGVAGGLMPDKRTEATAVADPAPVAEQTPTVTEVAATPAEPEPEPLGFELAAALDELKGISLEIHALLTDPAKALIDIKENTLQKTNADIWFATRGMGVYAEDATKALATAILHARVQAGQDPKEEWQSLVIRAKSNDAPKSVTGKEQIVVFGNTRYDFNTDALTWTTRP